jgi:hypothetical protein
MSTSYLRWIPVFALPLGSCIFVVSDGDWNGSHSFRGPSIRCSGVRAEVDRPVTEFRSVRLETCADVVVRVGEAPALRLAGDDNLLSMVRTSVANGVLSIDVRESCDFRAGLQVTISTPALDCFVIEGSGDVGIEGLAADQVALSIEGSGSMRARGTARSLVASIQGSGEFDLGELAAENADLSIDGSGSMDVRVLRALHYSIEGSGDIRYSGEPEVAGRIDGSGNVGKGH